MKRSSQALLNALLVFTLIGIGIIIWILLFNQKTIPQFSVRDGKDAVVNYEKIEKYIDDKVEKLPKAQDGRNADPVDYLAINYYIDSRVAAIPRPSNGLNGTNGKSCTVTQTESGALITCEDGSSAVVSNGVDGRTPELRCNDNKNRWEIRYTGDTNWSVLRNSSDGSSIKCNPNKL